MTGDENLLHAIEGAYSSIPKKIRDAYDRNEIINDVWLILKARGVKKPTRRHVRFASIDHHRKVTHFYSFAMNARHRNVDYYAEVPEKMIEGGTDARGEVVARLRDLRRRMGTDGLAIFLLTQVAGLEPRSVNEVMDFEPTSALALSVDSITEWAQAGR